MADLRKVNKVHPELYVRPETIEEFARNIDVLSKGILGTEHKLDTLNDRADIVRNRLDEFTKALVENKDGLRELILTENMPVDAVVQQEVLRTCQQE